MIPTWLAPSRNNWTFVDVTGHFRLTISASGHPIAATLGTDALRNSTSSVFVAGRQGPLATYDSARFDAHRASASRKKSGHLGG
jgi:hypothetical protein